MSTELLGQAENTLTSKYKHHKTQNTVDFFINKGWKVVEVLFTKTNILEKKGKQKHLVRMRNDAFKQGNDNVDIIITNSYDGTTCLVLNLGFFRFVCSNGLIVGESLFEEKIKHIGKLFDEKLENAYEKLVASIIPLKDEIDKIKAKELTPKQKYKFAYSCIRKGKNTEGKVIDFRKVLEPLREGDKGNDAWRVFNVIQEKLTDTGIDLVTPAFKRGKKPQKKLRGIGAHNLVEINKFMFDEITKLAA